MRIILIGYRCTGKTSVGERLAEQLGLPFFDTDRMVCLQTGRTIDQIVSDGGWEAFRLEERAAVRKAVGPGDRVIALGGGAVMEDENVRVLVPEGLFVLLTADSQTILERMRNDGAGAGQRPPLAGDDACEEIEEVLRRREVRYRELSRFTVYTTGRTIGEIADLIVGYLKHLEKSKA
ncbi:MAG: shikimate kinase [Deltaproteobacteria bacterium]|nr:shikimate kinase [Deltaproteobacteria bacterium]